VRVGILTVSDRSASGERTDRSGPALVERIHGEGWNVVRTRVVSDDPAGIEDALRTWADSGEIDLIFTTGGTGFAPRDRTPEATMAVCDRLTPGLTEAMRRSGERTTPHAMLSRAAAGIRGSVLIVNLPGSPTGAVESLETILPALGHAIQLLKGDPGAEAGHAAAP
jgi:molybdopterin adenylyltransferase